jgi:hypothetical protein
MSTDRLEELGLPRRAFLKKAVAGTALIAPAIVSFGMDATAEGRKGSGLPAQSQPNQCLPNQCFPNQALYPGDPLWDILDTILVAVYESQHGLEPAVTTHIADKLASLAMQAAILTASDDPSGASEVWGGFIEKVEQSRRKLPEEVANELIKEARRAQQELA